MIMLKCPIHLHLKLILSLVGLKLVDI